MMSDAGSDQHVIYSQAFTKHRQPVFRFISHKSALTAILFELCKLSQISISVSEWGNWKFRILLSPLFDFFFTTKQLTLMKEKMDWHKGFGSGSGAFALIRFLISLDLDPVSAPGSRNKNECRKGSKSYLLHQHQTGSEPWLVPSHTYN